VLSTGWFQEPFRA